METHVHHLVRWEFGGTGIHLEYPEFRCWCVVRRGLFERIELWDSWTQRRKEKPGEEGTIDMSAERAAEGLRKDVDSKRHWCKEAKLYCENKKIKKGGSEGF